MAGTKRIAPARDTRRPPLPRRAALGRLAALGAASSIAASARAQDDELLRYAPRAGVPAGYPAAYATTVRAAEDEGRLIVHSTTDERVATPSVADFRRLYPRIAVAYEDLNSTSCTTLFIAENQLGREAADVLWSSAMDQMVALAVDGHALTYDSPEGARLPAWARWQDRLWASTYEPVVFAYHKPSLPEGEAPRSHAALARWLADAGARGPGGVVGYDVQNPASVTSSPRRTPPPTPTRSGRPRRRWALPIRGCC
ncbi:MAG: hypothetical protein QM674_15555 [Burkholderiaceae bacterium]